MMLHVLFDFYLLHPRAFTILPHTSCIQKQIELLFEWYKRIITMSVCQNHKFLLFSLSNVQSLFYLFVSCAVKLLFSINQIFWWSLLWSHEIFHVLLKIGYSASTFIPFILLILLRLLICYLFTNWCLFKLLVMTLSLFSSCQHFVILTTPHEV